MVPLKINHFALLGRHHIRLQEGAYVATVIITPACAPECARERGYARVRVRTHALERYIERGGIEEPEEALVSLCEELERMSEFQGDRYLTDTWVFVFSLDVLMTCYKR